MHKTPGTSVHANAATDLCLYMSAEWNRTHYDGLWLCVCLTCIRHVRSLPEIDTFSLTCLYSLMVVEVVGKRSRIVPILLTPDMTSAIDILVATREQSNVPADNDFVFAIPNTKSPLSYYHVLHRVSAAAGLHQPHLVTTTRLRKRVATMAQVTVT